MVVMMGSPGLMVKVAEGASNALAPPMPVLFSRQVQPAPKAFGASLYLPAFHKLACRAEAHRAKAGCQGWTRTRRRSELWRDRPTPNGLIPIPNRDCFDTTWQWLVGAAGRSCTCIGSFRRRTPCLFRPRQHFEMARRAVAQRAKVGRSSRIFTCDLPVPSRAL